MPSAIAKRRAFRAVGGVSTDGVSATGESGAWGRIRTTDTRIFNPLLYQLSYPGLGPPRGSRVYKRGVGVSPAWRRRDFPPPQSSAESVSGPPSSSSAGTA